MKYLIVSDIHGASDSVEALIRIFNEEKCDYILCLGDILYHGPRNDLPPFYNPKKVISLLNPLSDKILCVKGNCEAEVDQMVLSFKIHDYLDLDINGKKCHLEHGHHLDEYKGTPDIVLYGHTHITDYHIENNIIYINPGSITIPKNGTKRGYAIMNENKISVYSLEKNIIFQHFF